MSQPSATAEAAPADTRGFYRDLRTEVHAMLEREGLSEIDDAGMRSKAVIVYAGWFASWLGFLAVPEHGLHTALLGLPLCFFMYAMQLSVMHDGSHKTFGSTRAANFFGAWTLVFGGASAVLWHKAHVVAHHSYTNIKGHDFDFENGMFLRFHSAQPTYWFHRYQHLYAWLLYSLHSVKWVLFDDIKDYVTRGWGLNEQERKRLLLEIVVAKPWHVFVFFIAPALAGASWGTILAFYLLHWLVLGVVLTTTFLLAHLTGVQEMPADRSEGHRDWALHQLATTADFCADNGVVTWVMGGLNFQVVHHIFPGVSHTRYARMQPHIKDFARRRGVTYREYHTLGAALADHYRHLRYMGRGGHEMINCDAQGRMLAAG